MSEENKTMLNSDAEQAEELTDGKDADLSPQDSGLSAKLHSIFAKLKDSFTQKKTAAVIITIAAALSLSGIIGIIIALSPEEEPVKTSTTTTQPQSTKVAETFKVDEDYTGRHAETAKSELERNGWEVTIVEGYGGNVYPGYVIYHVPAKGEPFTRKKITLYVSDGSAPEDEPTTYEQTQPQTQQQQQTPRPTQPKPTQPATQPQTQPQPTQPQGYTVKYNESGRTAENVKSEYESDGWKVNIVEEYSDAVSKGLVIRHTPAKGETVTSKVITLYVSKGRPNPNIKFDIPALANISLKLEYDYGQKYGYSYNAYITNTTSKTIDYAEIDYRCYDKNGIVIKTATIFLYNIGSQETVKESVFISPLEVVRVQITGGYVRL